MRIGILISGRGSNMLALAEAIRESRIPGAEIAVVISDHADAPGLSRAASAVLDRAFSGRLISRPIARNAETKPAA